MNYITQIALFYGLVVEDGRLTSSHISIYLGLFQIWNKNRFENPIPISRKEVMLLSRVGSTHTYYKTLSDLHEWGYLEYMPEKNPLKNSLVNMKIFIKTSYNETDPILKTTKEERDKTKNTFIHSLKVSINKILQNTEVKETIKLKSQKDSSLFSSPTEQDVKLFFINQQSTDLEALKFFNHYQSNGWRVGGKSPMHDWQASARKWIINNIPKQNNSKKLNQNKNYNEPL